jgi:hypothetical protein
VSSSIYIFIFHFVPFDNLQAVSDINQMNWEVIESLATPNDSSSQKWLSTFLASDTIPPERTHGTAPATAPCVFISKLSVESINAFSRNDARHFSSRLLKGELFIGVDLPMSTLTTAAAPMLRVCSGKASKTLAAAWESQSIEAGLFGATASATSTRGLIKIIVGTLFEY